MTAHREPLFLINGPLTAIPIWTNDRKPAHIRLNSKRQYIITQKYRSKNMDSRIGGHWMLVVNWQLAMKVESAGSRPLLSR